MGLLIQQAVAQAQTAPDAGQSLRTLQRVAEPTRSETGLQVYADQVPLVAPGGPRVPIRELQLRGHSAFTSNELLAVLALSEKLQALDFAEIQTLAARLTQYYHSSGYLFARVFVPPQDLSSGTLWLEVVEGRYGEVLTSGPDTRWVAEALPYLQAVGSGARIEAPSLERVTLLLADLPGVRSIPMMRPGQEMGTGDLEVRVQRESTWRSNAVLDNHGNAYSGPGRMTYSATIDSPWMMGDQVRASVLASQSDLYMVSGEYSFPISHNGQRVVLQAAKTHYDLKHPFDGFKGAADQTSAQWRWSLVRSRLLNLSPSVQYSSKRLHDKQLDLGTKRTSETTQLGLNFDWRDGVLGGAVTYGALSLTHGRLHLDDTLRQTDASTAKTEGGFSTARLDLTRLQSLPASLTGYARVSAQWAAQNLDSSEGFSLGGPSGVRAYPVGEGSGDAGWLLQLELRAQREGAAPYAFVDMGGVKVNAKPWDSSSNKRHIGGAGVGVRAVIHGCNLDANLAWRTRGGVPQADTRESNPRLWVSAGWSF